MSAAGAHGQVRAVLDPLGGIGLDELVASAALLTRVDRKYVLRADDALTVLDDLARTGVARVLEIDGSRQFGYESVYFDTPDLASFRLTATRRRRRFKVRTRTYLDSGLSFLEVKTRAARGTTLKQREPHLDDPATLGGGCAFVAATLAAEGVRPVRPHALEPGLVSQYRRLTLHLPSDAGGARATVDTGLAWELDTDPAGQPVRRAVPHLVVVETKGGSTPSDLDRLLWRHGHRPERISKYGTGLALLRPDLPDGPWRRVIRRHLTDAPAGVPTRRLPARTAGHPDDRST
ncbi:polyphosphate polymerase domain-containing protein [Cellulosimicrobium marinum]|uniref:polyphosphate polymerase domain-containing protein n=1 Tax=Cellulosimicrobium marinum TaxID=1638992 RepID=UPI001E4E564A|nr:polyphosphate polymerase domain-containing protein [Cellulosimicrobium marinum]MCB7136189.1 polyphosphate polymerase domain-containing protein [Cellulosimicrobium marinum]